MGNKKENKSKYIDFEKEFESIMESSWSSWKKSGNGWLSQKELEALQQHPKHQARKEQFGKERTELEKYIIEYQEKYTELKESIDAKIEFCKYGKGGDALHRGTLCPSKIIDVVVGNIRRGRLLEEYKDNVDYIYGFDENNKLCKVETKEEPKDTEYIIYEGEVEIGLTYDADENLLKVSECKKKNGRLIKYLQGYSISEKGTFETMDSEKYDYSQNGKVFIERESMTLDFYKYRQLEVLLNQEGYGTKYYTADIIGEQVWGIPFEGKFDRKVNFFSEKENEEAKSNEKDIQVRVKGGSNSNSSAKGGTEMGKSMNKLCEQLYQDIKSTIESWEEPDIYAISFLVYNINEATQTPILELGYNTEEQYLDSLEEEEDTQEVRWNYAYWIQNQEYIFGYDETEEIVKAWLVEESLSNIDEEEVLEKEFIKQLIFVAQELHNNNIIRNHFKKDIPILIHGLEYYDKIAHQTELANPKGVADEFVSWIKAMY